MSNGTTDDLFPVDEAVRFGNRLRERYPRAVFAQFHFDWGHTRGQNKPADATRLAARRTAWFAHYLEGQGPTPFLGVEFLDPDVPEGRRLRGPRPGGVVARPAPRRGALRLRRHADVALGRGGPRRQPGVQPDRRPRCLRDDVGARSRRNGDLSLRPGRPGVHAHGIGDDRREARHPRRQRAGGGASARRRSRWAPDAGRPHALPAGPHDEVAGVPAASQRLALRRGHIIKLELLGNDASYGRMSNGSFTIGVSALELRLSVHERPGAAGGAVKRRRRSCCRPASAVRRTCRADRSQYSRT